MRIERMLWEHGNDFSAIIKCENCGATHELTSGYHDNYYHTKVLPGMFCTACGKDRAGASALAPGGDK